MSEPDEVDRMIEAGRRRARVVEVGGFALAVVLALAAAAASELANIAYIRWAASW